MDVSALVFSHKCLFALKCSILSNCGSPSYIPKYALKWTKKLRITKFVDKKQESPTGTAKHQHKRHKSSTGTADTSTKTSRILYRDGGHINKNVTNPLPGRRTHQQKCHESSTGTADTSTQTSRVIYRDGGHINTNVTSPLPGRQTHQHKRLATDNE